MYLLEVCGESEDHLNALGSLNGSQGANTSPSHPTHGAGPDRDHQPRFRVGPVPSVRSPSVADKVLAGSGGRTTVEGWDTSSSSCSTTRSVSTGRTPSCWSPTSSSASGGRSSTRSNASRRRPSSSSRLHPPAAGGSEEGESGTGTTERGR